MSRRRLLFAAGLLISALFLWLALRQTSFAEIHSALSKAQWLLVVPFLASLFMFYWIKTIRWRLLLAPIVDAPTRALFAPVMIGYAGSTVLPMQLGEVLRTYVTSRQHNLRMSSVLASIVLERIFDLVTIFILLGIALLTGTQVSDALVRAGQIISLLALGGLAFTFLFIFWKDRLLGICRRMLRPLPDLTQRRILDQVEAGATGLQALRSPVLLLGVLATSAGQWAFMWCCVYISIVALQVEVPVQAAFVVLSLTVVSVTLPSSPGFIGSIQLAFTLALAPYGVAAGDAFAASVFFHVLAYFSVLIVGFFFLYRLGYTLRGVRAASEEQA